MLTEKEFLQKCLEEYNNKSTKIMKSHEEIKEIFSDIEARIKNMEVKVNVKKVENK